VGLLSLVFAYWLFKVIRKIWNSRGREGLGYRVAFIVYTINMLFFASFYSPTILWIWFLLLGMVN